MSGVISVEYRDRIAILTINNEEKLNALNQDQYYEIAQRLREIARHDEIFITVLTAKGSFFSAGADISVRTDASDSSDTYRYWLQSFGANNLNATQAFYSHPKILVTALNGPVIGLSAALVAFSDFIYCVPHTFLLTPFVSLGLVTEGCASRTLVQRLGHSKANEALIMGKKITSTELLATGFVNQIFDCKKGEDEKFRKLVFEEIDKRLGRHLNSESMVKIKELIRKPEVDALNNLNVEEVLGNLDRFALGIPQEEFRKLAMKEKRHRL